MSAEVVTKAVLLAAAERGLHVRALARELGVESTLVSRGCRRHGVGLPSYAPPPASRSVRVCECGEHGFVGLPRGAVAFCDAADVPLLKPYSWTIRRSHHVNYAAGFAGRIRVSMHRLIVGPGSPHIDHRDSNGLNNRRANLRPCTAAQNLASRRKIAKSRFPYKGVIQQKGRGTFIARIKVNRRFIQLGRFQSLEDAARAYDSAAVMHFGEFALTNAALGLLPESAKDSPRRQREGGASDPHGFRASGISRVGSAGTAHPITDLDPTAPPGSGAPGPGLAPHRIAAAADSGFRRTA